MDRHRYEDAAIEAELETGRREPTVEAAKRHVLMRLVRVVLGFCVLIAGIAASLWFALR